MTAPITFKGPWDPTSASAPSATPASGDYWVVTRAGTYTLGSFSAWLFNDWAYWDGTTWQRTTPTIPIVTPEAFGALGDAFQANDGNNSTGGNKLYTTSALSAKTGQTIIITGAGASSAVQPFRTGVTAFTSNTTVTLAHALGSASAVAFSYLPVATTYLTTVALSSATSLDVSTTASFGTFVTSAVSSLPTATISVDSTANLPSSGSVYVATNTGTQVITYTGTTSTTLTGCSGGTSGSTVAVNAAVSPFPLAILVDSEIISYTQLFSGGLQFGGCTRGALSTTAANHRIGAFASNIYVDGTVAAGSGSANATLSSSTAAFLQNSIGNEVVLLNVRTVTVPLVAVVDSTGTDSGHPYIKLAGAATVPAISGAYYTCGTDDTAAWASAISALPNGGAIWCSRNANYFVVGPVDTGLGFLPGVTLPATHQITIFGNGCTIIPGASSDGKIQTVGIYVNTLMAPSGPNHSVHDVQVGAGALWFGEGFRIQNSGSQQFFNCYAINLANGFRITAQGSGVFSEHNLLYGCHARGCYNGILLDRSGDAAMSLATTTLYGCDVSTSDPVVPLPDAAKPDAAYGICLENGASIYRGRLDVTVFPARTGDVGFHVNGALAGAAGAFNFENNSSSYTALAAIQLGTQVGTLDNDLGGDLRGAFTQKFAWGAVPASNMMWRWINASGGRQTVINDAGSQQELDAGVGASSSSINYWQRTLKSSNVPADARYHGSGTPLDLDESGLTGRNQAIHVSRRLTVTAAPTLLTVVGNPTSASGSLTVTTTQNHNFTPILTTVSFTSTSATYDGLQFVVQSVPAPNQFTVNVVSGSQLTGSPAYVAAFASNEIQLQDSSGGHEDIVLNIPAPTTSPSTTSGSFTIPPVGVAITGATFSAGVLTVTTFLNHGLTAGTSIVFCGSTVAMFNYLSFTVATAPTLTTFTVNTAPSNLLGPSLHVYATATITTTAAAAFRNGSNILVSDINISGSQAFYARLLSGWNTSTLTVANLGMVSDSAGSTMASGALLTQVNLIDSIAGGYDGQRVSLRSYPANSAVLRHAAGSDSTVLQLGTNADVILQSQQIVDMRLEAYGNWWEQPSNLQPLFNTVSPSSTPNAYLAFPWDFVLADATSGAYTVVLPKPPPAGARVIVKKIDATANVVTVIGVVDGFTNPPLTVRWQSISLIGTGSAWRRDDRPDVDHIIADTDGATVTFDLSTGNKHTVTIAANRTFAVSNASIGQVFMIRVKQGSGGGFTVTWFSGISWQGGTAPTLTTTTGKTDTFVFLCTASGAYSGFVAGLNE